jgi:hypothetical protein
MVTKSQIKEISASLIGTERLAKAMAVVNGSEMREGSPFRVRRLRLARQSLFIARAQRRASFRAGQWSPYATRLPAMTHFNNSDNSHSSSPTPRTLRTDDTNTHNRGLIDDAQPRTINPSRSSDAILNPHETNQANTTSVPGIPTAGRGTSMHISTAGSLFSTNGSIVHDRWQQPRIAPSTRREGRQNESIFHYNWQQPRISSSARREGRQNGSIVHNNWQQPRISSSARREGRQNGSIVHDNWQQPRIAPLIRREAVNQGISTHR